MPRTRTHAAPPVTDDTRLRELGYTPQLNRGMSRFGNFAISFSVISVLSGCMTLYGFGLITGGPAVMIWGWVFIGAMVLPVGAALGEVTSSFPVAGALYSMADRLGNRKWGWYTGVLNLLGLIGGIAGIDFGCATFIGAFANLQWGFAPHPGSLVVIFAVILAVHAVLNLFGVRLVSILNAVSVWWHLAGVALIVAVLAIVPSHHQSTSFVFTHFANATGWHSSVYVVFLGLLLAQYTFCGYDASAHMSEETQDAQNSAAKGMVRSILVSWVAGLVLLVGMTYAIQDYAGTVGTATGVPPAQIFLDSVGGTGAKLLLLVVIVAQFCCGNAEVAAASRMIYAFSRDGAMPGAGLWTKLSGNKTPRAAVLLAVCTGFVVALPVLWSPVAYAAVTAINVVGMTPAYAIPIYLRLRKGRSFKPGPWNLGRYSRPIGILAVGWVVVATVLFLLPQVSPVTWTTMNYAPAVLGVVLLGATLYWPKARKGYANPQQHTSAELDALQDQVI